MMDQEDTPRENTSTNLVHTAKSRWYGPSIMRETESAVILSLPAARKIEWVEILKSVFFLFGILGLMVIPFFFTPEYIVWGVLLAIAVLIPNGYHWLYLFTGREELVIDSECIRVRFGIGGWKWSHEFMVSAVEDLRCTATTYQQRTQPLGRTKLYPTYVWVTKTDTRTSAIACDYHGQTVSLLGWIEKPLAKHFLSAAKRRFPNYWDRQSGN